MRRFASTLLMGILIVLSSGASAGAAETSACEHNDVEILIYCRNPITGEVGGGCVGAGHHGVQFAQNCTDGILKNG